MALRILLKIFSIIYILKQNIPHYRSMFLSKYYQVQLFCLEIFIKTLVRNYVFLMIMNKYELKCNFSVEN